MRASRGRPVRRTGELLALGVVAHLAAACGPAELAPAEAAAVMRAATTEMVRDIARNPGPIVVVCVGYEGDSDSSAVPEPPTDSIRVSRLDACETVGGRLVARDGGGPAISITLDRPERTSRSTARVEAITSTGSQDVASYTCTLEGGGRSWRARGCTLTAIS